METVEMRIGGVRIAGDGRLPVYHKATGEVIAEIGTAGEKEIRAAVDAAEHAFHTAKLSLYERYEILMRTANLMRKHRETFAHALSKEAGKPIRDARARKSTAPIRRSSSPPRKRNACAARQCRSRVRRAVGIGRRIPFAARSAWSAPSLRSTSP